MALIAMLVFATSYILAAPPVVSSVTASQRAGTKIVDIYYNLADADNHPQTITVALTSGGATLPATSLSGDVGANVLPGNNKHIIWDAGTAWPGNYAANVIASVTANDGKINMPTALYVVVDLSGGANASSYPISTLTAVPAGGWTDDYKTTKLVLRRINKGAFTMGSPSYELGRYSNEDLHQVTLTQDFYIGVFEVTQRQYELVMGAKPSQGFVDDMRPVGNVSYNMIRGASLGSQWPANNNVDSGSFMGVLRTKTGLFFDLPTEAQWEYACRAGTTSALNSGKELTTSSFDCLNMKEVGRYYYNSYVYPDGKGGYLTGPTKVGMYLPNLWGLYDMHGNVSEFCLDIYAASLSTNAATDPKGAISGNYRIIRGMAESAYSVSMALSSVTTCRSAYRIGFIRYSDGVSESGGFRVCIGPSAIQ